MILIGYDKILLNIMGLVPGIRSHHYNTRVQQDKEYGKTIAQQAPH